MDLIFVKHTGRSWVEFSLGRTRVLVILIALHVITHDASRNRDDILISLHVRPRKPSDLLRILLVVGFKFKQGTQAPNPPERYSEVRSSSTQ